MKSEGCNLENLEFFFFMIALFFGLRKQIGTEINYDEEWKDREA